MRRLIFLKVEYLELKGKRVLKADAQKMHEELCLNSITEFRIQMKEWIDNKSIKILQEWSSSDPQVLIQFDEKKLDDLLPKLVSVNIVDVIDSIMPPGLDT